VTYHTSSPLQDATNADCWGWFARVAFHSSVYVIAQWLLLLAVLVVCLLELIVGFTLSHLYSCLVCYVDAFSIGCPL